MYIDPTGHMNYLTQTDDLIKGIAAGIGDQITGIKDAPGMIITLAKTLISGELTIEALLEAGLEGMIEDYKYILSNASMFDPFQDNTDAQVYEMGTHLSGIVTDIALSLAGAGAAKLIKVLSKTKSGAKLVKLIDNVCFTEDTVIHTADGYKYIKNIQVGDEVYSENPETGEKGLKKVNNIFVNETDILIHVYVGNEEIKTTPSHPFWVVGIGWVEAEALEIGDKLLRYDGNVVEINKLQEEQLLSPIKVYNFEVEDWHSYFVSGSNVLVHNSCSLGKGMGKIDINIKPEVSNSKLKNIINDLYKGQGGTNTIGNGTTMDAVRNEILTGNPTNGKFHTSKLNDYVNALQKRLRAGDLNEYDESVVKAILEDALNALDGK